MVGVSIMSKEQAKAHRPSWSTVRFGSMGFKGPIGMRLILQRGRHHDAHRVMRIAARPVALVLILGE